MLTKISTTLIAIIIFTIISYGQPLNTGTQPSNLSAREASVSLTTEQGGESGSTNERSKFSKKTNTPKIVVGIVIEDMRPDYISRYWNKFRKDGFRRLVEEGHICINHHIDNLIQRPSAGMATLYTGTPPSLHGIVNDTWIDRLRKKEVNCTEDLYYTTVGSDTEQGARSAKNMMAPTIGDELKIASNGKSKVYSVALNPNSAIFSSGHASDGAYWLDTRSGNMISSSYYVDNFPEWAYHFNSRRFTDHYVEREWDTLLPIADYTESTEDDYLLEPGFWDKWNTFPYDVSKLYKRAEGYQVLKVTPFGNSLVKDFSLALIENEKLGKGENTDLITIVFSSMDYERNSFGPASVEMQDTYLRLDQEIAHILGNLDVKFGKENVLVYLTAVTSASYSAPYLQEEFNMNVGIFNPMSAIALLKSFLNIKYSEEEWIQTYVNQQIYLDRDLISKKGIDLREMQADIATFLNQFQGVAYVKPAYEIESSNLLGSTFEPFQNSYNPKRSGDVLIRFEEGWQPKEKYQRIDYTENHQVPLIWYGGNVKEGKTSRRTNSKDVVPTIAEFLNILPPNASSGKIIEEVISE